jgi:hypothetical protein
LRLSYANYLAVVTCVGIGWRVVSVAAFIRTRKEEHGPDEIGVHSLGRHRAKRDHLHAAASSGRIVSSSAAGFTVSDLLLPLLSCHGRFFGKGQINFA